MLRPMLFTLLLGPALLALRVAAAAPANADSDSDLICHPGKACYPRIFVPTAEFQRVEDDQDIPAGLHVRLNMATGAKEAKLYDRNADDDADAAHAAVAYVNADDSTAEFSVEASPEPSLAAPVVPAVQQLLQAAGAYGPIKPPWEAPEQQPLIDAALSALAATPSPPPALDSHLETLADLAADMYWGLALARNAPAVRQLAALVAGPMPRRAQLAARVLASALRNNAPALAALQTADEGPARPIDAVVSAARAALRLDGGSASVAPDGDATVALPSPSAAARFIALLRALDGDPELRDTDTLRALAAPAYFPAPAPSEAAGSDRARQELARLVRDRLAAEAEAAPEGSVTARDAEACEALEAWRAALEQAWMGWRAVAAEETAARSDDGKKGPDADAAGHEPPLRRSARVDVAAARLAVGRALVDGCGARAAEVDAGGWEAEMAALLAAEEG